MSLKILHLTNEYRGYDAVEDIIDEIYIIETELTQKEIQKAVNSIIEKIYNENAYDEAIWQGDVIIDGLKKEYKVKFIEATAIFVVI